MVAGYTASARYELSVKALRRNDIQQWKLTQWSQDLSLYRFIQNISNVNGLCVVPEEALSRPQRRNETTILLFNKNRRASMDSINSNTAVQNTLTQELFYS